MKRLLTAFCFLVPVAVQSQQLVNGNFEQWKDSAGYIRPVGWTPSIFAALAHSPGTEAYRDSFSLVLSSWYMYVPGHLFYGNHKNPYYKEWTRYNVDCQSIPLSLTGMYRYVQTVTPSHRAAGRLIILDPAGDTLAYGSLLLGISENWKSFEIPVNQIREGKPARLAILFTSTEDDGMNEDSNPNRLFLDDLQLVFKKD
jgi:hypothetical protein